MGTYGGNWAFWAGNGKFSVDQDGNLIAETGKIGGSELGATYIKSVNGNWELNSNGFGKFKDISINGVRPNSSFGTIGWNGSNNWGTFAGTSYFGSDVDSPFSGTTIPHIQSIAADYIKVNYLDAINANITSLKAKDAEIETLVVTSVNAINANINQLQVKDAEIQNLVATKASIEQLNAANAEINNLKSASINVNRLTAGTVNGHSVSWRSLNVVTGVLRDTKNILNQNGDSETISYVHDVVTQLLYVMCEAS